MFNRITSFVLRQCGQVSRQMCTEQVTQAKSVRVLTGERGRVGRDLEVRGTEENPVTLFPLATSQSYKQQDGSFQQYTEWHKIVVFKRVLGEVLVRRLGKGDRVYVAGSIHYNKLQDKETNRLIVIPQIRADDVVLLEKARSKMQAMESDEEAPDNSQHE
ncbi:hypothetical protein LSH36_275g02000 [Paralvinella palmiformis]|uniref:Single-stranded DNA-binding protein, mitochondrial n=1 Tax=Paralvinella palmiformis TaxID=53620 RepID=A0AAD9JK16_9ANNE|nr:hypothetical protein LSH36_275g02000 [Paralvinella palmiformis]